MRSDVIEVCVGSQLRTDVDERALSGIASVQPAVNQVELHPYFQQAKMLEYCDANKLVVMGYSPMGSSFDRYPEAHGTTLLKHPARSIPASRLTITLMRLVCAWGFVQVVNEIATSMGKSAGQVLIRFGLQKCTPRLPALSFVHG